MGSKTEKQVIKASARREERPVIESSCQTHTHQLSALTLAVQAFITCCCDDEVVVWGQRLGGGGGPGPAA